MEVWYGTPKSGWLARGPGPVVVRRTYQYQWSSRMKMETLETEVFKERGLG